nr:hypothetical protein [uncultured Shimia sp.]
MTSKQRFIKSIVATAQSEAPVMPWARGARRQAFIAKRNGGFLLKKSA